MENAKNDTEKLFYEMVYSFIDSHNRYKNLSLKSIKKDVLSLDLKISKLQGEIESNKKKTLKQTKTLKKSLLLRLRREKLLKKSLLIFV
ncbi:hypothetical protein [Borreliella bavariensis]|uniref:hypothetical protein n=1 Tax=Borreliella bavariensis TaxID=664662 RepID=UPI001F331A06|nr:hypothetical protein [Borreliella bavariensis]